jgi:hypothetical protein
MCAVIPSSQNGQVQAAKRRPSTARMVAHAGERPTWKQALSQKDGLHKMGIGETVTHMTPPPYENSLCFLSLPRAESDRAATSITVLGYL